MSVRSTTTRKTPNVVTVIGESARDPGVLGGVFDYIQGVVSSSRQTQGEESREKIIWARFETIDFNDPALPHNERVIKENKPLPLILILGYLTGYSVWSIQGDGEAKELLSIHEGPTRFATILKTPYPWMRDNFTDKRPIIAVAMKKGVSHPYAKASFRSLQSGEEVKNIEIDNKTQCPIVNILSNRSVVVVIRSRECIIVLNAATLVPSFYIKNNYKSDTFPYNPVCLGTRWLAYADRKLSSQHQSRGGISSGLAPTYKSTVISAAKMVGKGVAKLGDTVYQWMGSTEARSSTSQQQLTQSGAVVKAIVTILDLEELSRRGKTDDVTLDSLGRDDAVIANFPAHAGEDCKIGALAFDPSGTLLVTACTLGHSFHVFRILPHPLLSSQTTVHHLYTLHRGDTDGTVQDITISNDSRWISVSTLRGTSHVFPITPYGGSITTRTHTGDKVVNQLSKFQTTAGVDEMVKRSNPNDTSSTSGSSPPNYASAVVPSVHTWGNPRSPPLPSPLQLEAMAQIKQPYTAADSANNMPASSVTDELPMLQRSDAICIAAIFASRRARTLPNKAASTKAVDSLFILGANGVLTEHILSPQKAEGAPNGEDAPIELHHKPELEWNLLRKPEWPEPKTPYTPDNPLVIAFNENQKLQDNGRLQIPQSDSEWLANIEIETHPPPHRRLWMGPQFKFKTYQATTNSIDSQPLKDMKFHNEVQFSDDSSSYSMQCDIFGQSPELSVTPLTLQRHLLLDTPDTSQLELKSLQLIHEEETPDENVLEVFGSYKDSKPILEGSNLMEKDLMGAIDDVHMNQHNTRTEQNLMGAIEDVDNHEQDNL